MYLKIIKTIRAAGFEENIIIIIVLFVYIFKSDLKK